MNATDKALARFRELCLALPETSESGSWGHPNFRAGKKTFAAFELIKERPSFACRVGSDVVDQLLLQGDRFFATPYGRGQWISVWADEPVDWQLLQALIVQSYRSVALKRMLAALDEGT